MKPATIVTLLVAILGCPLAFAGTAERVFNLDVVELLAGREVAGQADLSLIYDGFEYHFATPENRRAFAQDPARYAVQMDGACSRVGALGTFGKPELYTVHDGRLYIFRTPECRRTFLNAPERFLPPVAPTTPVDPDVAAAGRQLIEQAIAAIGGRERLSQVKAWRYTTARAPTKAQRESRAQRWLRTADGRFRYDAFNGDQVLMRHSSGTLTDDVYSDRQLLDLRGALDKLPELPLDDRPETGRQKETGTHDAASSVALSVATSGGGNWPARTRTWNLLIQSQTFYRLNYRPSGRRPSSSSDSAALHFTEASRRRQPAPPAGRQGAARARCSAARSCRSTSPSASRSSQSQSPPSPTSGPPRQSPSSAKSLHAT
jgi:YHS domain-containing protein